jgi:acetylornithine/N-succinyldiaminopimelate aminotransferase
MGHILDCTGYSILKRDIVRAQGCHLFDGAGRRIVDFESGVWCAGLGHAHPRIQGIMHAQIERALHLGYRVESALAEEAAAAVLETLPLAGGKCLFLSSGSEAVELAAQIARRISGRPLLLGFAGAYLAAYGTAGARPAGEWLLFDWASCADCPASADCDPACPRLAEIPFDRIGAFVLEPGNSGGLVKLPPRGPVRALATRVVERGGLLAVDEVTTGLGRTGKWYGFEHYGLSPDLVALGKGLGNGYPVSAVAMTAAAGEALEAAHFHYAQSHQNDPLGCAVVSGVLAALRDEGLVKRSAHVGALFLERLRGIVGRGAVVREARGRGLMLALELAPRIEPALATVHQRLLDAGFLVGFKPQHHLLRFYPPLTIDEEDVGRMAVELERQLAGARRLPEA